MNRATRDKFAKRTDPTSSNACWETAPKVYDALNRDFGTFDVDLTADASNHLCDTWLGPGSHFGEDALTVDWRKYGRKGYSNPVYGSFITRILPKAVEQARKRGFASTFLLPLRITDTFREYVLDQAHELLLCTKRLVFFEDGVPRCTVDKRGRPHADTAMFDSIIVRYLPGRRSGNYPKLGEWDVPEHVTKDDIERWVVQHGQRERPALGAER